MRHIVSPAEMIEAHRLVADACLRRGYEGDELHGAIVRGFGLVITFLVRDRLGEPDPSRLH